LITPVGDKQEWLGEMEDADCKEDCEEEEPVNEDEGPQVGGRGEVAPDVIVCLGRKTLNDSLEELTGSWATRCNACR
jgi:hypothetical protein